jgi:Fe-S cluster assembly protein SufD
MSSDTLRALGLPTVRDEAWKYAARTLSRRDWWSAPTDALSLPDKAAIDAAVLPVEAPVLVFAGGHAVPRALGGFGALPAGVSLRPLAEEAVKAPTGDSGEHRVAAIAAATTPGAWELAVAANVDAGSLQLLHLPAPGTGALVLRIRLARGARLQLLESLADGESAALAANSIAATETDQKPGTAANTPPPTLTRWLQVQLADGANLTHAIVQQLPLDAALLEQLDVSVGRDATYLALPMSLGTQAAHTAAHVALEGAGASGHWQQFLRVDGNQHTDVQLTVTHTAANTVSTQAVRALAGGRSRGAFSGKVVMPPSAHGADSAQSIRNLLLSATAELDTRPQLEIHVDDVKASHGSTTGSLDQQALFYLRSRGIGEQEARRLLMQAFAADVIARLPWPSLREWLAIRVLP